MGFNAFSLVQCLTHLSISLHVFCMLTGRVTIAQHRQYFTDCNLAAEQIDLLGQRLGVCRCGASTPSLLMGRPLWTPRNICVMMCNAYHSCLLELLCCSPGGKVTRLRLPEMGMDNTLHSSPLGSCTSYTYAVMFCVKDPRPCKVLECVIFNIAVLQYSYCKPRNR